MDIYIYIYVHQATLAGGKVGAILVGVDGWVNITKVITAGLTCFLLKA